MKKDLDRKIIYQKPDFFVLSMDMKGSLLTVSNEGYPVVPVNPGFVSVQYFSEEDWL